MNNAYLRQKQQEFQQYWADVAALPPLEKTIFYLSLVVITAVLVFLTYGLVIL